MFVEHKREKDQYVVLVGCVDSYCETVYEIDNCRGIRSACYLGFDKGIYDSVYFWHEDPLTPPMAGPIPQHLPVIISVLLVNWSANLNFKRLA